MPVIPTLSPHRAAAAGSEQVAEPRFEDIDAAHRMLAPLMEAIAAVAIVLPMSVPVPVMISMRDSATTCLAPLVHCGEDPP